MLFKSKKKKRPIDVFDNIKKAHLEEAYARFQGKKLKRVSKIRGTNHVEISLRLLEKLKNKYGTKYTVIHTHPNGNPIPSVNDLTSFLSLDKAKTSIIVPLDRKSYQSQGYFVMKKNKDFKLPKVDEESFSNSMQPYSQGLLSSGPLQEDAYNLKKLAKKYNFSYRFFPIKGKALAKEAQGFKSSRQTLETRLVTSSLVLMSLSILVSLSNITGNVISESLRNTSSIFGAGLFILGLCFAGLVFFVRRRV